MHVCILVLQVFLQPPYLPSDRQKIANFTLFQIPEPSPYGQTGFLLAIQCYFPLVFCPDLSSGIQELFFHTEHRASPSVQQKNYLHTPSPCLFTP